MSETVPRRWLGGQLKTGVIPMGERQDTGGLATALALIGASGVVPGGAGGQEELFGAADAPLPLPEKGKSGSKGGRPAGARNRSTEEWARFLLSRSQSPLVVLAEIYSRPVAELTRELQALASEQKKAVWCDGVVVGYEAVHINPLDVLKLQMQAAQALAPYLHKQQPKAIEVDQRTRGIVILGELNDVAAGSEDDLTLPLAPIEENQ